MKFTDGFWMAKPGVTVHGCAEIRDIAFSGDKLTAFISPFPVSHRGQTLGGPLLTLEITAPRPDILGVKLYHYKDAMPKEPAFELFCEPQPLAFEETDSSYTVRAGAMAATLLKGRYALIFSYSGKPVTRSDFRQAAYLTAPDGPFIRERLDLGVDEYIYGLGERFTPFVKNGQSVDIWNEDGGTASDIAYKNIPFYLSSKGFGVFADHPERVSYEIASEAASRVQFSVAGEELRYFVIGGGSVKKAVANYCALTGKPPLPPAWSFGLWLSTSFTTDYDEQTVNSFIDGMAERGIPLSVFHYDCFWMKEYEWCNFTWDAAMFPEPAAMLKRLHEKGLRVCVWINSYIGQKSPLFDEAAEKHYLLRKTDGTVWQWDRWQPGMGLVDFTNPDAAAWFAAKLEALADMGVDCFKTDFGERIPTEGIAWFDGSDPQRMHNYYTFLYNQTVHEMLERKKGKGGGVLFARSATVGGQRFPVHWGGDCEATYAAMAETLRGGLSLALGGFAFWSHDISGFEATATPDLYKRWVAFGLFSTHSRLHGSSSYRVPWNFDGGEPPQAMSGSGQTCTDVLRHFTKVKHSLMPYLYAQAVKATQTGVPVMRPMVMEYPDDPLCLTLDRQYMLGDSLLVAPVFHEDGHCDVYLPDGMFTNFFTGEVVQGGRLVRGIYNYMTLPAFIPENTLLAMGRDDCAEYEYHENITVHAYQLTEQTVELYDKSGNLRATVTGRAHGDEVTFQVDGDAPNIKFEVHK
ncbi:MAG: alpha-xylosidase [Oscillospiraceae bacterium]|jgi:alpha-D-xyloside xylohydrolase|nr:alpha-xylosidase [Oscillospiraceae bacterium]